MTQLEALKTIAARNKGLLRPIDVVNEARDENSPLHGAFEWDDGIAAEKYRLEQAQHLIRSFKISVQQKSRTIEVPVFVGVSTDRTGKSDVNPYRFSSDVAKDENLLAQAEQDALEQLQALKNRYSYLKRFQAIWDAIKNA